MPRTSPGARAASLVALVLLVSAPRAALAQEPEDDGAHIALDAGARTTDLRGESSWLVGGSALFDTGGRLSFGGAGWVLVSTASFAAPSGSDANLDLAFGGGVLDFRVLGSIRRSLSVRSLIGAGSATVTFPRIGTIEESDNFAVIEPELAGAWRLFHGVHLSAGVAYRWTIGVEDLTEVFNRDLRGASLRVGLTLRD